MSKVIDLLHADHNDFDRMLEFLTNQLELRLEEDDLDYELVYDVMYYISHFPDRYHHPIEDLIYKKLCLRDPLQLNYVNSLLDEHQLLAAKSLAFFQAIKNVLNDSIQSFEAFGQTAKAFIQLQREHIRKEEGEVLPLVQKTLKAQDWYEVEQKLELMFNNEDQKEDKRHRENLLDNLVEKIA